MRELSSQILLQAYNAVRTRGCDGNSRLCGHHAGRTGGRSGQASSVCFTVKPCCIVSHAAVEPMQLSQAFYSLELFNLETALSSVRIQVRVKSIYYTPLA